MNGVIKELILFLLSYIIVFLLYRVLIVRRAKGKGRRKTKEPFEITYLVSKYNIDLKKVNYNRLLLLISLVSSFDIALIVTIIISIKNFILAVIVGFISMMLIILISYHIVYLIYKKKGMIKNESKRNRK